MLLEMIHLDYLFILFNKEEDEKKRYREENDALAGVQKFVGGISGLMNPAAYVIINGAVIAILYTGAVRVDIGSLTQGEVIALVNYMSQILVELVKMANLIITLTKAVACGNRVQGVLETKSSMAFRAAEVDESAAEGVRGRRAEAAGADEDSADESAAGEENAGAGAPAVEFRHVSLTYAGAGSEALTDISFSIRKGDTLGIIGGTGSGKTSVVSLIPRFYDATAGTVLVDGRDVKEYGKEELRKKIGVVPQKAVLFAGTIAENLRWGKEDASDEELRRALETSQAAEFVEKKDGGLDAPVLQGGKNLSGGQRQRLTIARALVRRPKILILDDSASALDFATDAALRRALKTMDDAPAVCIVSQRTSSIRYADQILVLEDGKVAGLGTHEQLLKTCPVYQEIHYSQFDEKTAKGEM